MLQGQSLLKAKACLTHGMWLDWLHVHCPLISARTATSYMRVASNQQRAADFDDRVTSLRTALFLCAAEDRQAAEPAKATNGEARSWPAYLEAISRVGKLIAFILKHPLKEWPAAGLEELRKLLFPLAAQLWPEKF